MHGRLVTRIYAARGVHHFASRLKESHGHIEQNPLVVRRGAQLLNSLPMQKPRAQSKPCAGRIQQYVVEALRWEPPAIQAREDMETCA